MFEKGSYVVYGSSGICKVDDIAFLNMPGCDCSKQYYVLSSVSSKGTKSFLPVDNTKVVLRDLISETEALSLIEEIPEIKEIGINNDKAREEKYKQLLRSCDCRDLVCILKTIHLRKRARVAIGKKITVTDDRYYRLAEEYLYSELGMVLGKEKHEMESFVAQKITELDQA